MSLNPEYLKEERSQNWRSELRAKIKGKDRTAIVRVKMPELEPEIRVKSQTKEVNRGLELAQAQLKPHAAWIALTQPVSKDAR